MRRAVSLPWLSLLLACGGASSTGSTTPSGEGPSGASIEDALLLCHANGGPGRTDYSHVASYTCPDGSQPLLGDPARGAAARVGNVGQGPDGHVIDHYEVPCPSGPVQLYVDGYHCEGMDTDIDPANLSDDQLANVASIIRGLEEAPLSERAEQMRPELLAWLEQTPQVSFGLCGEVVELVEVDGYAYTPLLVQQLFLSSAATIIERHGELDYATLHASGLAGVLRSYQAIRGARPDGASAALDSLIRRSGDGSLGAELQRRLANCEADAAEAEARTEGMAMVMTRDGQNVWPPQGPECERLVRCCEGKGYIRNGAAVSSEEAGAHPMMCQLAAAAGTCADALAVSLAEVCADY